MIMKKLLFLTLALLSIHCNAQYVLTLKVSETKL